MSGEQITAKELNSSPLTESSIKKNSSSKSEHTEPKVNINILLSKVREERNKERKENYIFLVLICGLVAITGVIASF